MAQLRQRGVGYLFMLWAVFLLSLGLGKALDVYATAVQREREEELLHVGALYRDAIRDYYLSAPNGQHRYPNHLEDLLKDSRHQVTRRYLRQLYPDPMTVQPFTPLLAPQGGIWGVASPSTKSSLRTLRASNELAKAPETQRYRDWEFFYDGGPS
jgi:type II secretory pathway pseudopilin PulG